MPKPRGLLLTTIAIVAILVGAWFGQFTRAPSQPELNLVNGTLLPSARALPDFQLVDSNGHPFTRTALNGRWSVLFFGFTHCPDICPTTLTMLAQVEKALADVPETQRLKMVFVSVDPKRDTPEQVGQYLQFFSPAFVGLTGEQAQIDAFTQAMGVPVAIHDLGNGAYTVDHAATLFLLDPQARMAAVFSPPHHVATLAADLRTVVTQLSR